MKEFKGTRGEVELILGSKDQFTKVKIGKKVIDLRCFDLGSKELKQEIANGVLITDAFKVRQQINCELSDLLENFNSAISLLKQTTEYEVLQSFRDKVSILEKIKDNE